MRQVILLRGVNVGGRRLAMSTLREVLGEIGLAEVATLLQSGNAVVTSELGEAQLREAASEAISAAAGFAVGVVVRGARELAAVLEADPLGHLATDPKRYLVSFCAAEPPPDAAARLRSARGEGEEVAVLGREIYTWHPGGVGRSRLWERAARLGGGAGWLPLATARNWSTVQALANLAGET